MLIKEQIDKLKTFIYELEDFCQKIDNESVGTIECDNKFWEIKEPIQEMLGGESDEGKKFYYWNSKHQWHKASGLGHATTGDKQKILELINIVKDILNLNSIYDLERKEYSFNKENAYEANRLIWKLLKSATNKIIIWDNYLDGSIFDFLEEIDNDIEIFLLTDDQKPMFKNLFDSFIIKRSKVYARINNASHDRYVIIDDKEFWSLGASINTIGKKDFMIHKIETEEEKSNRLNDFNKYWNSGESI